MKIGVIGFGNLGKSFVSGVVKSGMRQEDIGITAKSLNTINNISNLYPHVTSYMDKKLLVQSSDIIFMVVEPQKAYEVFEEIKSCNFDNKIIVSLMAGVTIDTIRAELGDGTGTYKIVRAMPNIAISMCNGIIGISYTLKDEDIGSVISLFEKLGYVVKLEESRLESITITAASGLAFVSCLMDAYQTAVELLVKDATLSQVITQKVMENVTSIIAEKNITFRQLEELITTKGGVTEAGLKSLDRSLINETLKVCLTDAYNHTKKLKDKK